MNSIFNKMILGVGACTVFLASCKRPDNTYPVPELSATSSVLVGGAEKNIVSGQAIVGATDTVIVTFKVKASGSIKQIDFNYNGTGSYEFVNPTGWYQQRGWIPVVQKRDNFVSSTEETFSVKIYNVASTYDVAILVHDANGLQSNIARTVYRADGNLSPVSISLYSQHSQVADAPAGSWYNLTSTNLNKSSFKGDAQLGNLSKYIDLAYDIDSLTAKPVLASADSAYYSGAPLEFKQAHDAKIARPTTFATGGNTLKLIPSTLDIATATGTDLITTDFVGAKGIVSVTPGNTYAFITSDNRLGLVKVDAISAGATSGLANAKADLTYIILKATK